MKILLIPDSFKDSISATSIIEELSSGFTEVDPSIEIETCIASDGGEGFLSFIQRYVDTDTILMSTVDPLGRDIEAMYAFAKAYKTAYIELAKASGLELLSMEERNPLHTSTYGTGLQIKDAIERGAEKIYVGLGGSATNDGGAGMAAALGYEFIDKNKNKINPTGKTLETLDAIVLPKDIKFPKIYAINDVDNPLTGINGASFIYAKQKGATSEDIVDLEANMERLLICVKNDLGKNNFLQPGAGAAGGSGFGLTTFFNADFISGVSFLTEISGIESLMATKELDCIITGEGSIDTQTMNGKLVKGITQKAKGYAIPVYAICGINQLESEETEKMGLKHVFSIMEIAQSKKDSFINAPLYIKELSKKLYKVIKKELKH